MKQKIFLILDGHPVHKSRKVKAWIAANNSITGGEAVP
jgi:hypothetical protein